MHQEEIDQKIIPFLESLGRYNTLITRFTKQKTKGYAFELYFAYAMEKGGTTLDYEQKANASGKKRVDFHHGRNGSHIWFELVSPFMNDVLKNDIKQQLKNTESDGISYYQIALSSRNTDPNHHPDAQLIRLQQIILEKSAKFSEPSSNTFNVIVVDCSDIFLHKIDADDFRNITYGYASDPWYQAYFDGERVKGLLEEGFDRRGATGLQSKLSALICLGEIPADLFNQKHAYITCNPLLNDHYNRTFNCLKEIPPISAARYINPIKAE